METKKSGAEPPPETPQVCAYPGCGKLEIDPVHPPVHYIGPLRLSVSCHFFLTESQALSPYSPLCSHGIPADKPCWFCGPPREEASRASSPPELQVFKSLADKVEDGEVSIDELCRDERQRERAINLCKALALSEDEQVISVIVYSLNLWMDWETNHEA